MTDFSRREVPLDADEPTMLLAWLDHHRDTLRWKADGLDQAQLNQPLAPSTMTLGGLLKHMALVESSWFHERFAGGTLIPPFDTADWDADWDWEWHSAKDDSPEELRALFDRSVAKSDEVVAAALAGEGMDAVAAAQSRKGGPINLRWIVTHMIEEYARHNGHADLIREAVDGSVGA
ncbi:DinB family protein [Nocardioides speluncae]|uniref:DinB family protein n=1 Tax=Nocardioides speluncae TaxID=2670337 RepID=UPI000D6859BA|nr:DinB family protein [Nocardioides speluncae]